MRVLMTPHLSHFDTAHESGIKRVVEAYFKYLPQYGVTLVNNDEPYDLHAVHAGISGSDCDVSHLHGLYWTADYDAAAWEWRANKSVVDSIRGAREVTVPSDWVAETLRRDLRIDPTVVWHGIETHEWRHALPVQNYVLWNKNRNADVCDPSVVGLLARRFDALEFRCTFAPPDAPQNVNEIGLQQSARMKQLVQSALAYLSTTKETFGIGTLEALASGTPVLGWAHGGNLIMVRHGVNGYLAAPGDLDDLARGLEYILQNRDVLSANARVTASEFTWEREIKKVVAVYERALREQHVSAAVIIPTYNYADKVGRAIESAAAQTKFVEEIIVVDDGSDDDTRHVVERHAERDARVSYVHQQNAGVANARNNGVRRSACKYVCCLDADDAIAPSFIETCVNALERERDLSIAYTGLHYIKPDGEEGLSQWPGDWDFDAQLNRQNQIPTCAVMRREVWERLGGQRQRYAPLGAGSEDADFWTRAGAYGFRAAKVDARGLFIYSWQSGRVSGDPNYREVDWLAWHPWATDGAHPLGSYATPQKLSHPVRQYDEPIISVVIPVGAHHVNHLHQALDSLDAQTLRKWEVVVSLDGTDVPRHIRIAYPHVRWIQSDTAHGAGAARNAGVEIARAPLLLFLDADDWLLPHALEKMYARWLASGGVVYSDHIGKAIVDDPQRLSQKDQKRLLEYNERTHEAVILRRALPYDCERAVRQPDARSPYIWCLVSCLFPREYHDEIGGMDEQMRAWEDWKYWIDLARRGKCFHRISEPLVVYRFATGTRREDGRENKDELLQYLAERIEGEPMGCGCKSNDATIESAEQSRALTDADLVMARYASPNRGKHGVVGAYRFNQPIQGVRMRRLGNEYVMDYGYRAGGETFLVHREDMRAQPHLFEEIATATPQIQREPLKAQPQLLDGAQLDISVDLALVPGVTPQMLNQLNVNGIVNVEQLAAMDADRLARVLGDGSRVDVILSAARQLI